MASRTRTWMVLRLAAFAVVIGLLAYVLSRVGCRNILAAVRQARPASIWRAAGLFLVVFILWTWRWQQLMSPDARGSVAKLLPIMMAGIFGNVVTPGARVGGEPIRAYYMSKVFGGEQSAHLGTVLADKLSYGLVFVGFLLASVAFAVLSVPMPMVSKAVLVGASALVLVAVASGFLLHRQLGSRSERWSRLLPAAYNWRVLRFMRRRFPTYQHFEDYAIRRLDNVWNPIASVAGSPKVIVKISLIGAASWLLFCLAHHELFEGLGLDIGFPRVLVIVTLSTFLGDVSVAPGGAGFMEAAMIGLCAAFGVGQREAVAVTLISRGLFYAYGLGVGGLCVVGLSLIYGRKSGQ